MNRLPSSEKRWYNVFIHAEAVRSSGPLSLQAFLRFDGRVDLVGDRKQPSSPVVSAIDRSPGLEISVRLVSRKSRLELDALNSS